MLICYVERINEGIEAGCPRVEGDEDEGVDMDDFDEEFQVKSPNKSSDHNQLRFDVISVK